MSSEMHGNREQQTLVDCGWMQYREQQMQTAHQSHHATILNFILSFKQLKLQPTDNQEFFITPHPPTPQTPNHNPVHRHVLISLGVLRILSAGPLNHEGKGKDGNEFGHLRGATVKHWRLMRMGMKNAGCNASALWYAQYSDALTFHCACVGWLDKQECVMLGRIGSCPFLVVK